MKNTPLTTILLAVLTISALASVALCWLYISNTRQLRTIQTQTSLINNNRAIVNALANETVEYSKTHPAIQPVLQSLGYSTSHAPAATSTKPATK